MTITSARAPSGSYRRMFLGALIAAVLLPAAMCLADTLVLKNGRSFNGRLISSDDDKVVFEIHKFGSRVSRTFNKDEVASIVEGQIKEKPKSAKKTKHVEETAKGPCYFVIPIKGAIGREVTNDVLKKCLNVAKARKPEVVMLEVDSPGGSVQELADMLDTLRSFKGLRIVAYFNEASSAAALLSMACKEIIASPTGTIGGAVVYRVTPWGTPTNINEKMASILRAKFRAEAQNAGHDALLVEGMMRTDLALRLVEKEGKYVIVSGGKKGKLLKAVGKILTLDAAQAVECGLAMGQAETIDQCNTLLGIEKWRRLPDTSRAMFTAWEKKLAGVRKQFDKLMKEAEDCFNKAGLSDPSQGDYYTDVRGRMTPASRQLWRQRSDRCAAYLAKSEKLLSEAGVTAKKYPQLGFSQEGIEAMQRRVAALKAVIRDGRRRGGL